MITTSVALCTYNGAQYVEELLQSIARQQPAVDEIVVCDDGSTDRTVEIVRQFARMHLDINVQLHLSRHVGLVQNSQNAVNLCSGEIIFIADQDDKWLPGKVQTILQYMSNHPEVSVLFTNASLMDGESCTIEGKLFDWYFPKEKRELFDHGFQMEALASNCATAPTMALRREFARLNPFAEYAYAGISNDYLIALIAASQGRLGYLDQPLIRYRIHSGQMMGLSDCVDPYPSPVSISEMLLQLPVPEGDDRQRLLQWFDAMQFASYRRRTKHLWLGTIAIIRNRRKYRLFYHRQAGRVLRSDIRLNLHHSAHRIRRKMHL